MLAGDGGRHGWGEPLSTDLRSRTLAAIDGGISCRATLEALAKLDQPREQTVRHVHVDNRGGQAVIAETVQTGGGEWKCSRTIPCNRSDWPRRRAAWPERDRVGNAKPWP